MIIILIGKYTLDRTSWQGEVILSEFNVYIYNVAWLKNLASSITKYEKCGQEKVPWFLVEQNGQNRLTRDIHNKSFSQYPDSMKRPKKDISCEEK